MELETSAADRHQIDKVQVWFAFFSRESVLVKHLREGLGGWMESRVLESLVYR